MVPPGYLSKRGAQEQRRRSQLIETLHKFASADNLLGDCVHAISLLEDSVTIDDVKHISAMCPNIQCLSFRGRLNSVNDIMRYMMIPSVILKNHNVTKLALGNSRKIPGVGDYLENVEEGNNTDGNDDDDNDDDEEEDDDLSSDSETSDASDSSGGTNHADPQTFDQYKAFITKDSMVYLQHVQHLRELKLENVYQLSRRLF